MLTAAAWAGYEFRGDALQIAGRGYNLLRAWNAPQGTLTTELAADSAPPASGVAPSAELGRTAPPPANAGEWPSFNRTLTSERYSPLRQIDHGNVATLKVMCTYDTGRHSGFQTGMVIVAGALIGTTETDIFSIDPGTCKERWRTNDHFAQNAASRGIAYLDGLLFRGTGDGRVLAYDFKTGARVWDVNIANPSRGETVPSAPIAWNDLVFIGNAGGDRKGGKGRMYALDARTGRIVWEFYLVPKESGDLTRGPQGASPLDSSTWGNQPGTPITGGANWASYTLDPSSGELYVPAGNSAPDFAPDLHPGKNLYSGSVVVLDAKSGAYKRHFEVTAGDWHDWDVSNAPALIATQGGKRLMSVAPKDGRLYGFDLDSSALLYMTPVNRIENADALFSTSRPTHFCPGGRGGGEWNSPAYDPPTNLIFTGEVEWCTTATLQTDAQIAATKTGKYWVGMAALNPYHTFGVQDSYRHWAGWLYATDADTGVWRWRAKSNYPILGAVTPTAGGIVFFGDIGGNFYALDSASGKRLWFANLGGAIAGGVVTYAVNDSQRIAVAVGYTAILWPTKDTTAKIVVLAAAGG